MLGPCFDRAIGRNMSKGVNRIDGDRALSFEQVVAEVMPLIDTPLGLEIQLGQARLTIRELLELEPGSLVELKKSAGEPMDVVCKNRVVLRGEVTVLEDTLGLRVTEIVDPDRKV
jgi:flagellar motor switch protein FliN/FliY